MLQNLVAGQQEVFKQQLHQMWFSFYSRSNVRDDTCGFEHGAPAPHACRALKRPPMPNAFLLTHMHQEGCQRCMHLLLASCLGSAAAGLPPWTPQSMCRPPLHFFSPPPAPLQCPCSVAASFPIRLRVAPESRRLDLRMYGAHRALCKRKRKQFMATRRAPFMVTHVVGAAVFVGEVDEGKVVGFHNWIQFHFEERAGRANYLGHLLPRGRRGSATHDTQTMSHAHRRQE